MPLQRRLVKMINHLSFFSPVTLLRLLPVDGEMGFLRTHSLFQLLASTSDIQVGPRHTNPPVHNIDSFPFIGATTVSFRAGGDWSAVLSQTKDHANTSQVFVTIQFGHNDQKAAANISIDQFKDNLGIFVDEVVEAGGSPILITSLTRRVFTGDPPKVVQSLANERNATITVAEAKGSMYIDLNLASENYCNAIGPEASYRYNLFNATRQGDTTHLNEFGGVVFGRLVSDLLNEKYGDLFGKWTVKNETLSEQLAMGVAA